MRKGRAGSGAANHAAMGERRAAAGGYRGRPGAVKAGGNRRVGIADAAAMGRVVHPHPTARRQAATADYGKPPRIDRNVPTTPFRPAPTPERNEGGEFDSG